MCCHSHPDSSLLLLHLMTSEFTQMHWRFCGFCLAYSTLCGSQALSTVGHTVAWAMAKYHLADSEVGMWSSWGCAQSWAGAAVDRASQRSTSSEPWALVCGSEHQGWFALASDPEHSDVSIWSICPTPLPPPAVRAVSSQLVCGLRKAVQFHRNQQHLGCRSQPTGLGDHQGQLQEMPVGGNSTFVEAKRRRKKNFLTLIGTKPSPHGSFWGTDPSMSLVFVSQSMLIPMVHALGSARLTSAGIQHGGLNPQLSGVRI